MRTEWEPHDADPCAWRGCTARSAEGSAFCDVHDSYVDQIRDRGGP